MTRLLIASLSVVLFIACSVAATRYPGAATSKIAATGSPQGPFTVAVRVVASAGAVPTPPPVRSRVRRNHPTPSLDWNALAACESSNNPRAVDPSGTYFGLYQFDLRTWAGVGGQGLPSEASPAEQLHRARLLFADRGRAPWPVCGARL